MSKNIASSWNEEQGISLCSIRYHSGTGMDIFGHGHAECHDNDKDFQSELTGDRRQISIAIQAAGYERLRYEDRSNRL